MNDVESKLGGNAVEDEFARPQQILLIITASKSAAVIGGVKTMVKTVHPGGNGSFSEASPIREEGGLRMVVTGSGQRVGDQKYSVKPMSVMA